MTDEPLPVSAERLRKTFPDLTDEDLLAYETITRRLLGTGKDRARKVREVLDLGKKAADLPSPTGEDLLALRYFRAVAKMQGPSRR
jgi:hypothetical protein